MRTLIISDLHIGSISRTDLLRQANLREALTAALAGVDRLVLLGDVLELRHGPAREAMSAAQPVFEALGRALGDGELVVTAGNHDHALIEPWLAARGELEKPSPLALEHLLEPAEASRAYARIAEWAAPARTRIAYPGLWLRDDVYATHGHYLDSHLTVPTLERLTVGAMSRLLGHPPSAFATVGDYEAVGAPMFAWRDAVARDARVGAALNGIATVDAWRALGGSGRDGRRAGPAQRARARTRLARALRRRALVAGFPVAVAALNRAGIGPLKATVSGEELRRAGLLAMGEVAARLGIGDAYVVFGHTHRPGPLPDDDPAEWVGRGGARLWNCGSWTYSPIFISRGASESPYWPGAAVLVEDSGAPQVLRLLQDRTREEIRPPRKGSTEDLTRAPA
ncbi:MAG TPA: metallophosphoesterase [Solirubrobacteraceae bacterium]|jgi:predicted phosphodiesterase|nr:metallophosphoesterase [Solirubrobacteraceae bacterium]